MEGVSKPLYLGGILGGYGLGSVLSTIAGAIYLATNDPFDDRARTLQMASFLPIIVSLVFMMILLYKSWDAIQDGRPRTTPGTAVGLMFIPCWHLYWIFQVYHGWMVDYNRMAEDDDLDVERMPEGLALAACIWNIAGIFVSIIPFVGMITPFVSLILWGLVQNKIIDGMNALVDAEPGRGGRYDDDDDDYDDRRRSRSRGRSRRRDDDDDDDYDDRRSSRRSSRSSRRDDDDDDRDDDREEPKWNPRDEKKKEDRYTDRKSDRRDPDEDEDEDRK